jgi:predicted nucleic acid-binding protein
VAIKWFLTEPDSEHAEALLISGTRLIAPDFLMAEVANAAWKAWWRSQLSAADFDKVVRKLPLAFDHIFPSALLAGRASEIARELEHPAYDCFYLALAEDQGAALVTADRRLMKTTHGTGWATVIRPLAAPASTG